MHCWHTVDLAEVARQINPTLRGWVNYYGRFHRSALHTVFDTLDTYLVRWLRRKYQKMKEKTTRARQWLGCIRRRHPTLFVHWSLSFSGGQ